MAPRRIQLPDKDSILAIAAESDSRAAVGRRVGIKPGTFNKRICEEGWAEEIDQLTATHRRGEIKPNELEEDGRFDHDDGSATVVSAVQTGDPVCAEDVLRAHKIDPAEWRIVRQRANAWNAMTSDKKHGDNRVVTMHQLRIDLVPVHLLIALPDPAAWKPPPAPKARRRRKGEPKSIVVCGDHHCPHNDKTLHELFLQFLTDTQPDEGVINGDLLDFHTISRHREREGFAQPANECIKTGFEVLMDYRHASPNTRWTMKRGNHDQRLYNAMVDNVRALHKVEAADDDIPALSLRRLLHLDELGIEMLEEDWDMAKVRLSPKLTVRHGPSSSKNATARLLEKFSVSVIQSHTHRLSMLMRTEHSEDEEEPTTTRLAAEAGCMCEVKDGLGYSAEPNWQQGALLVHVWPDGDFHVEPIVYVPGRLLAPGGRRYEA